MEPHCVDAPSPWVVRWAALIARGPVLDLACGSGRHARFLSGRSLQVVAVDRGAQALPADIRFVQFDLESSAPWPFRGERFGAIVVTNYLHRPLFPDIAASLGEGG